MGNATARMDGHQTNPPTGNPLPLREDCARYESACPFESIPASHA